MKRMLCWIAALTILVGCGSGKPKIALVLSVGGIEDKSFNQSAYEGFKKASKEFAIKTDYADPKGMGDFETCLRKYADEKYDLVIAIGFCKGAGGKSGSALSQNTVHSGR